jgi:hypothetical protein
VCPSPQAVGLPLCLCDLGVSAYDLDPVVAACLTKGQLCLNMPMQLTPHALKAAILGADSLGRATRARAAAALAAEQQ